MFEAVVSFGLVEHFQGAMFDPPMAPIGYRRAFMPSRRPFATRDGHLCLMPYSDAHWRDLLQAVDDQQALADERFVSLAARTRHIDALYERLATHLPSRTTDEWLTLLRQLDIPAARMNRLKDLQTDPQLKASGHFIAVQDEQMGTLVFPANPVRFDGWRPSVGIPPRLGQDTQAVLSEPAPSSAAGVLT